ncbi:MAG: hypothetical protein J5898_05115, partial [Lachnospiraceae bacterium]|nr:hypothetical protein [Lachnospiraceae bacterium]
AASVPAFNVDEPEATTIDGEPSYSETVIEPAALDRVAVLSPLNFATVTPPAPVFVIDVSAVTVTVPKLLSAAPTEMLALVIVPPTHRPFRFLQT